MLKSRMAVVLLVTSICSACSTYKTNTDLTFDSVWLSGQVPAVYVGEIENTADQLTFLGWVDAQVNRPSIMHEEPTKEQADIVLAYQAKQLGADAVTHVTYKRGVLTEMIARGQAVIINSGNRPQPPSLLPEEATAATDEPAAIAPVTDAPRPEPEKVLSPAAVVVAEPPVIAQNPASPDAAQPTTRAQENPAATYFGPLYEPPTAEELEEMAKKARLLMDKARVYRDQEIFNNALELLHFIQGQQSFQ